jgi:membrane protease YdiL (CAAX protease family)
MEEGIKSFPRGESPPLWSLLVYMGLVVVVAGVYLALRVFMIRAAVPLVVDLYVDEIIFFFLPLLLVLLIFRLPAKSTLQLRSVSWKTLPLFVSAGFVLVVFQVFLLAVGSRFVPDIARYLDLNTYFGYGTFAKTLLALPLAGQVWVVCLAPAFVEELVFRGYVQATLVGRMGVHRGVLATGVLFALVHLGMLRVPFDILVSYIMGYMVIRYGSIWPAVVFHFTNNLVNLIVLNVLPNYETQQLSLVSVVLMSGALIYLGWQIGKFLLRVSSELKAGAVGLG